MKNVFLGFICGVTFMAAVCGYHMYTHMIDMNQVVAINCTDTGAEIRLESGEGYYWGQ